MILFRKPKKRTARHTVLGIGNCQVDGMARCAAAALGFEATYLHLGKARSQPDLLERSVQGASIIFCQRRDLVPRVTELAAASGQADIPVIPVPNVYFPGFHPDVAFPSPAGERPELPMGNANSAIVLAAWREGFGVDETISLFREEVFDALGYFETFGLAKDELVRECNWAGFDVLPLMNEWLRGGPFVFLPLHPKIEVLRDIALIQLRAHKLNGAESGAETVEDEFARNLIWPVYSEIAARLDLRGDYIFRPKNRHRSDRADLAPMDLPAFVERTFACFDKAAPILSAFQRMEDPRLRNLRRFSKSRANAGARNPYRDLGASHWWSKAVAEPRLEEVDPVAETKFRIGREDRVATAGSCFAQHISRRLSANGFNFLVTERAPAGCADPVAADYGVFTARFGNIYTVRQLLQLADRAYGLFEPAIDAWKVADGFIDPFRPRIGGAPFRTLDSLRESRETHLAAVREMFEVADVFVFTLGLTEGWTSRDDEAVVPLPPGVVDADIAADAYVPRNFGVAEVLADLESLVQMFGRRNPKGRILLTVSPVPLIATHSAQHVLAATIYSKSVLRAAAGEVATRHQHVDYFPSYEIITGSFNRGRYFAEDLRQVTDEGVDHVMRLFLRHYADVHEPTMRGSGDEDQFRSEAKAAMDIICDEEEIGTSVTSSCNE